MDDVEAKAAMNKYDTGMMDAALDQIAKGLKRLVGGNCCLCKALGTIQGVWAPKDDEMELWGGEADKVRLFLYNLCDTCQHMPDIQKKLEAEFAKRTAPTMIEAD